MKHNKYLKNKVEFERRQFIAQKAKDEQENENLIRGSLKADYVVENKYRCDDDRREQQYTPRQRACKKLLDEKTNVGKFTEICAAAMAILAIAIFTGIFLFLLIMFSNLETPTDDAVTPQLLGHTTPESSNAQLSFLIDANDG